MATEMKEDLRNTLSRYPHYNGPCYDPALDQMRLNKQLGRVFDCMQDGLWRSLADIAKITGDHEASISAQLRHLRKPRFGSYIINKRRCSEFGLWQYRLLPPKPKEEPTGQRLFF